MSNKNLFEIRPIYVTKIVMLKSQKHRTFSQWWRWDIENYNSFSETVWKPMTFTGFKLSNNDGYIHQL